MNRKRPIVVCVAHAQAPVSEVGEDPEVDAAPGEFFDDRGEPLAGGVDRIGTHGIPDVVDQVQRLRGVGVSAPDAAVETVETKDTETAETAEVEAGEASDKEGEDS